MIIRIFVTLLLVALILYTPWWVAFLGIVAGAFLMKNYYEMIGLGILYDFLYGTKGGFAVGYGYMGMIVAFVMFVVVEKVKKELR